MMYPGTIFELIDQSQYEPIAIEDPIVKPLFMTAITSDKGPEDYQVVEGDTFFKLYGDNISFAKHGQPLLQAANIINAGGRLFVKRVVDPASTLGNVIIFATISKVETQKTDADGNLIYINASGNETTDALDSETGSNNTPVMVENAVVKYSAKSVTGKSTINEVVNEVPNVMLEAGFAAPTVDGDGTGTYPLFVIADNGRGLSNKYIQINADYTSSKSVDYTLYMFKVIENNVTMDNVQFAFDPDKVDGNVNVSMDVRLAANAVQIKSYQFEDESRAFMKAIASLSGLEEDLASGMDYLFCKTRKGDNISGISIDADGINLANVYGIRLDNGSDGNNFDTKDADGRVIDTALKIYNKKLYATEMAKVFSEGNNNDEIFDLDKYKIDLVVDACYPEEVKRAIERFVSFRQDCFYFRDQGLGLRSLEQILAADTGEKNKFCATYLTTYDIIDPYSQKQVTVTMMYSLARLLVSHFANGRNRPLAGQLHNMILTDAIEGTVNFIPTIVPSKNQKDELAEARINYASYFDNLLVLETLYTSQEKTSQFSFVNNILAVQEIIKAVRTRCPKTRYTFMDGDDLEKYKEDVQAVLDKYSSNFMELTFEYISDATYISNKIFYGAIKVKFRNFIQTEYFKVIALPS